ncbi:protein PLASTID MOVEMENT IMPAIRED 1-RELATED 1-like isoform X2 [Cynara cardunculus var. scolymus]|uniref:protein PLASTID MOVEMENT IMPAIRED 1-RELATED 1-like isoform X2 n=1 Tax=Cynara cardunculus var. scolymus TaxID=59895 RepID=UPI000D62D1ED|nr:protein PLASTID MOVEMENT IMPAIRED 1-RELATED 1-like isoform X2 [Cynara cardunculus var. scolymus]
MMMSNEESGWMSSDDFGSSRLLHDIEEIRKALYSQDAPSTTSMPPRDHPPWNPKYAKDDLLPNGKKSSIWKWKPLKALTHIRNHRLSCCFFLHVHSIEGLPLNFNELSLCVYWKRKHEVLKSHSIRVKDGVAEFEETLIRRCSVYVSRSDPHDDVAKYEPKLCVFYASVVGAPGLDLGKHRIDLTRLLPLTLMELEEEKNRYGKWVTSFKLSGKAKGATINVSFGFSLSGEHFMRSSNLGKNLNILKGNGSSHNGMLQRVGSIPSNSSRRTHVSNLSLDMKVHNGIVPYEGPSIPFLYQLLDESKSSYSKEFNSVSTDLESSPESEVYDSEFTILDRGTEFATKDQSKIEEDNVESVENSCIETINVAELFEGDGDDYDDCGNLEIETVFDDISSKEHNNVCTEEFNIEDLELFFHNLSTFESQEMDFSFHENQVLEHDYHMKNDSICEGGKMVRSHSLDDLTNVVDDFMNLVGSDSEPESPRELLLRQFEKEALVSGNFAFDLNPKEEQGDCSNIFDLSFLFQETEMERNDGVGPSLISRRKAKILENLETEALMQEWGLNERAFQNSPRTTSGAFGSPVYLSPERPSELPSLGEGLGSFLKTGNGGFLRSMDPSLFKRAKNGARLIVHVSSSVVLPPAMGSNAMDILLNWATVGAEKMHLQATRLMPMEEITGKTLQQTSWEAESQMEVIERGQALLRESEAKEMPTSICREIDSEYVSEGNTAPLAIEKIQYLLIEGLRIQSGMSTEEPPSSISVQCIRGNSASTSKGVKEGSYSNFVGNLKNIEELMDMSISLEEWMRLDSTSFDAKSEVNDHISKVFATRCAKMDQKVRKSSDKKRGHLSNNFTLALQMLLRDPFRDYEPVGIPMLALVQVERTYVESIVDPMFKITEVHVTGLRADPGKKQQSGSRWLHSSGMTAGNCHILFDGISTSWCGRLRSKILLQTWCQVKCFT